MLSRFVIRAALCKGSLCAAFFFVAIAQAWSQQPISIWAEYAQNPNRHPNIPNNSYAGYRYGEVPIPTGNTLYDGSNLPVINVKTSYGAIGNGIVDDTSAIKQALAAVPTTGAIVYFPNGTYKISDVLKVLTSRTILRGQSRDNTKLIFTKSRRDLQGGNWTDRGGLLQFGTGWTPNYALQGQIFGTATGWPKRGDMALSVNYLSFFPPGSFIQIVQHTQPGMSDFSKMLMGDGEFANAWFSNPASAAASTEITGNGASQAIEIAGHIGLNTMLLRQPLRVDLRPEWSPYFVMTVNFVMDSGIDTMTVHMNRNYAWVPNLHRLEAGWNGVEFLGARHCFARNITVEDTDGFAVRICGSKNVTVSDILLSGSSEAMAWQHHAFIMSGAQDSLVEKFQIESRPYHGLNLEVYSMGNVYSNGKMFAGTFDYHRYLPFENIITQVEIDNDGVASGSATGGPPMGARNCHWNINGKYSGAYMVNEAQTMPNGALIGVHNLPTVPASTITFGESGAKIVAPNQIVPSPPNLYQAQFAFRVGRAIPMGGSKLPAYVAPQIGYQFDSDLVRLGSDALQQDGWRVWNDWASGPPPAPYSTVVTEYTHPLYPSGINAIKGLVDVDGRLERTNSATWWFPPFRGDEPDATMYFDYRGWGRLIISGVETIEFGATINDFRLRVKTVSIAGATETTIDKIVPLPTPTPFEPDWVRMQLMFNFRDYGGQGSVSMFWRNLSRGDVTMRPVPNMQRLPLNGRILRPFTWNTIGVFVANGNCITNIVPNTKMLRTPFGVPKDQ